MDETPHHSPSAFNISQYTHFASPSTGLHLPPSLTLHPPSPSFNFPHPSSSPFQLYSPFGCHTINLATLTTVWYSWHCGAVLTKAWNNTTNNPGGCSGSTYSKEIPPAMGDLLNKKWPRGPRFDSSPWDIFFFASYQSRPNECILWGKSQPGFSWSLFLSYTVSAHCYFTLFWPISFSISS
jgi:hypothetical protein